MSLFAELKRRNVIRVAIAYVAGSWLLIQVAETIFPLFGFSDAAARLIVMVLAVGFVPVLVFAWAFQLTPQGLKFDSEVAQAESIAPQTGKLLDRVIMITLALAVGYFAFDKFVLDPVEDVEIAQEAEERGRSKALIESYGNKSIVVLPFVNMSPDPDQAYFADGISEELLNLLAKIPELRVISRSSAFSFRGDDINVRDVAEQLDVSHVLEGSVRKMGNQIRITAQLIEARTDTHLWSETYDRELDNIFAIQDEIALTVVGELEVRLLDEVPTSRTTDPDAYTLFLHARNLLNTAEVSGVQLAESLLKQALEIDPDYAPAWSRLAMAIAMQPGQKYLREEADRLFNEALEKALAADPGDGVANAYLGWERFFDQRDPGGVRLMEEAIAQEPNNVEVVRTAGGFARAIGHWDTAVALGQRAVDLDPLCHVCYWNLTVAYLFGGRMEEAEVVARKRTTLFDRGWHNMGTVLLIKGDAEAALKAYDELQRLEWTSQWLHGRTMALYSLDRLEESRASLAEFEKTFGHDSPSDVAQLYAWTGEADAAFEWLGRALNPDSENFRFYFLAHKAWHPSYRSLHDDPRWNAYWEVTGTTPEELQAIEFNVDLPAR